jgi:cytochrome c
MGMPRCHQLIPLKTIIVGTITAVIGFSLIPQTATAQSPAKVRMTAQPRMSVVMPLVDANRGRRLFVTKGCFICHSVKGVGGKAAPALDAASGSRAIDVLGFVARMWKGAPLMFELQSMELGYRIEFKPDEIADLAGFIGDARAQEGFSREEIPEVVQEWVVNQAWWKDRSIKAGDILPKIFPDLEATEP